VMLLGHNDEFIADKNMKVTIVFNYFGPELVQRMPRVRNGYVHVANNRYEEWEMYAIGGSANPTILSEGNYFNAPKLSIVGCSLQVTKRETDGMWKNWKWRSSTDVFENGAYFVQSGWGSIAPLYSKSQSFTVADGSVVPYLTSAAGPLHCRIRSICLLIFYLVKIIQIV
ncbi:Pectate lyase, partial [Thalictrum thalictroides]